MKQICSNVANCKIGTFACGWRTPKERKEPFKSSHLCTYSSGRANSTTAIRVHLVDCTPIDVKEEL